MKKLVLLVMAAFMLHANCNAQSTVKDVLSNILGSSSSSSTASKVSSIADVLGNVIGSSKLTAKNLIGTWKYSSPGVAFTSENLLAKAGGEVASKTVENKLSTYYKKVGIKSSNTYFTFKSDGSFTSKIDGKTWSGTYTYDESTNAIKLKGLVMNISGYATKNSSGISLLFESKKLLTLLQTISSLSGNTTLSTLGTLSKNYNGIRVGFDLKK